MTLIQISNDPTGYITISCCDSQSAFCSELSESREVKTHRFLEKTE